MLIVILTTFIGGNHQHEPERTNTTPTTEEGKMKYETKTKEEIGYEEMMEEMDMVSA